MVPSRATERPGPSTCDVQRKMWAAKSAGQKCSCSPETLPPRSSQRRPNLLLGDTSGQPLCSPSLPARAHTEVINEQLVPLLHCHRIVNGGVTPIPTCFAPVGPAPTNERVLRCPTGCSYHLDTRRCRRITPAAADHTSETERSPWRWTAIDCATNYDRAHPTTDPAESATH